MCKSPHTYLAVSLLTVRSWSSLFPFTLSLSYCCVSVSTPSSYVLCLVVPHSHPLASHSQTLLTGQAIIPLSLTTFHWHILFSHSALLHTCCGNLVSDTLSACPAIPSVCPTDMIPPSVPLTPPCLLFAPPTWGFPLSLQVELVDLLSSVDYAHIGCAEHTTTGRMGELQQQALDTVFWLMGSDDQRVRDSAADGLARWEPSEAAVQCIAIVQHSLTLHQLAYSIKCLAFSGNAVVCRDLSWSH